MIVSISVVFPTPFRPITTAGHERYALVVLLVVAVFNHIDRTILSILQVPLKRDLGLSDKNPDLPDAAFAFDTETRERGDEPVLQRVHEGVNVAAARR